jgi:hypothetical protein
MELEIGGVPAVMGGTMISMGRRRWRSQVPSIKSPECLEGLFSEVAVECVAKRRPSREGV